MGDIQGQSGQAFTDPNGGVSWELEGSQVGIDRADLNVVTDDGAVPFPSHKAFVENDAPDNRANVQFRFLGRVPGLKVTLAMNGASFADAPVLDPAAYGATAFVIDEVSLRVLSLTTIPAFTSASRVIFFRNGATPVFDAPLFWSYSSTQIGAGAVIDLSLLTWLDSFSGDAASLGSGKIEPGTFELEYLSGAVAQTITDDGIGGLTGAVTGGATIDYTTGALSGSTSLVVDIGATVDARHNTAVGFVRIFRAGDPAIGLSSVIEAPDTLTAGVPGGTGAGLHQVQATALGRLIY